MVKLVRGDVSCVVCFHPNDRQQATRLASILKATGRISCSLQSSTFSQLVQTASSADCTLALITATLFDDKIKLQRTKDVFSRYLKLGREIQFIPILTNIKNSIVEDSPDFTFLESVSKIRARWDEVDFRDNLLEAICSAVGVDLSSGRIEQPPIACQSIGTQVDLSCTDIPPCELDQTVPPAAIQKTNLGGKSFPAETEVKVSDSGKLSAPTQCSDAVSLPTPMGSYSEYCLISRGSRSDVYRCIRILPDNRRIELTKKIPRSSSVALKSLQRVTAIRKLRSPWLLPILDVMHSNSPSTLQFVTPYMSNGSLESHLQCSASETIRLELTFLRAHRLTVLYQVSGGISFLHDKNIVHGDICPSSILLDAYGNARLSDYNRARHINAAKGNEFETDPSLFARDGYRDPYVERIEDNREAKCLSDDVFSFGITAVQMLKWNLAAEWTACKTIYRVMTLFERLLDNNQELPTGNELSKDERFIDQSVWSDDELTREITDIVINCLKPTSARPSAIKLTESMDSIMTRRRLPRINFPEEKCVYCNVGELCRELQLHSSKCPQSCTFLQVCRSCMIGFVSSNCPLHGSPIHPPVGGEKACALIMCGRDSKDPEFEATCTNDATSIREVANHPKIIGIPVANTFFIDNTSSETEIDNTLQQIEESKFDFILIYYTGHGISASDKGAKLDVSKNQGLQLNISRLQKRLHRVSRKCSRIFVTVDCCSAEEIELFSRSASGSGAGEMDWQIRWFSCRDKEDSHIDADDRNSTFTRYILSGLTGATQCPNGTEDCRSCSAYKDFCRRGERSVLFGDLSVYVEEHMKKRPRDGLEDRQNPVVDVRGNSKQVIAHFVETPLYTFHFETPDCCLHTCTLDLLGCDMEDVLIRIWRQLEPWLPNNVDYKHLRLSRRLGTREVALNTVNNIVEANADDENALFVRIKNEQQT